MTFPNVTALREMATRVISEYLHQFADMGVEKIALITGDPRIPDSAEDPFGRRCSLAVKAGNTGGCLTITAFWPEEVFRQTMDYIAEHRHDLIVLEELP